MKATVTAPETWKKVIEIEIDNDTITSDFNAKVKKYTKEIKVPGFRQGKVPVKMVISRFGESIRAEVLEELMNKSYRDACVENKITPVSDPIIEDVKSKEGEPVLFKATIEVDPEIEIVDYKGFEVAVEIEETTEAEITEAIDNIREQYATFNPLETAAVEGNVVTVKYSEITVDGEVKEGFLPAPQMIEVGKAPLAELDEALKGIALDEEKKITATFPEDFRIEEVAGQSTEFTIVIEKIQEKILPEINEEFLKMVNFETEEAFNEAIRKDIETHKQNSGETKAYDEVIDKILEKNEFAVPQARISHYIQHIIQEESRYFPNGGQPAFEDYVERYTDVAKKSLQRFRILDFIAKAEGVKATQAEVDEKIQAIADQYQQPFDVVKQAFRQNGTTVQIREDIKEGKTLKCLIGSEGWPSNAKEETETEED